MLKRKRVYICDHCGAVALEETYFFMTDVWKGAPEGWTKLGKEDLCPTCSKLMDSWKKSPTINLSKSINISKGETTNA